jgi:hypothetical protein
MTGLVQVISIFVCLECLYDRRSIFLVGSTASQIKYIDMMVQYLTEIVTMVAARIYLWAHTNP